jgi:K+-transporting ATPase ATPase B chain
MAEKKGRAIWDLKIVQRAIWDSILKLNPRKMMGNPVMFVVEVGSVLTTVLLVRDVMGHQGQFGFNLQITLWLWFTVLLANFAEAMAEGRGKAQADACARPIEQLRIRVPVAKSKDCQLKLPGRHGVGIRGRVHSG